MRVHSFGRHFVGRGFAAFTSEWTTCDGLVLLTLGAGCLKQEGCSSSSTSSSTWVVLHLYIQWNPAKMIFVYTRGSLGLLFCCRFLSLSSCYIYRPWAFLYSHVYQKFRLHSTVISSWYNFLHMTEENYIVFIGTNVFFCYIGNWYPLFFRWVSICPMYLY